MIVHVRMDERLIHGQVATAWIRYYDANAVIIPSDEVANSEIDKMALKLAASMIQGLKLSIVGLQRGIELLHDPRCESMRIMIVCRTPQDVLEIAKHVEGIPGINLANYGDQKKSDVEIVKSLGSSNTLRLSKEDLECVKQIVATGIPCWIQKAREDREITLSSSDFE